MKKLRTIINSSSARSDPSTSKKFRHLQDRALARDATNITLAGEVHHYKTLYENTKAKKTRNKTTVEQLHKEEGSGALLIGPTQFERLQAIKTQKALEEEQQNAVKQQKKREIADRKAREATEKQERAIKRAEAKERCQGEAARKQATKAVLAAAKKAPQQANFTANLALVVPQE